jgi:PncC family amidohydrolase
MDGPDSEAAGRNRNAIADTAGLVATGAGTEDVAVADSVAMVATGAGTADANDAGGESRADEYSPLILDTLAAQVLDLARGLKCSIGTAESCTGGMVAETLTAIPGSSDAFFGSIVSYDNQVKMGVLHVSPEILDTVGAVSEECARSMASGARAALGVDLAISTTGIAGPTGETADKPAGLVCFAIANATVLKSFTRQFKGGRDDVRRQATYFALETLRNTLQRFL